MTQPHPFRRALEAGDVEAMVATLSPEVVVHGPAVQRPVVGRAEVSRLLEAVVASFQAFTQEFRDGPRTALVFEARIRDRLVQGMSLLEDDEHGRVKTSVQFPLLVGALPRCRAAAASRLCHQSPAPPGGHGTEQDGSRRMRAPSGQRSGGWSPTRNPCR
jgi:SnoaL-like domain